MPAEWQIVQTQIIDVAIYKIIKYFFAHMHIYVYSSKYYTNLIHRALTAYLCTEHSIYNRH